MRRAVAFCSSIKASKAIANAFTDYKDLYMEDIREEDRATMVDVVAHHVDGSMSATKRDEELMWLKEQPENERECRMLTNARAFRRVSMSRRSTPWSSFRRRTRRSMSCSRSVASCAAARARNTDISSFRSWFRPMPRATRCSKTTPTSRWSGTVLNALAGPRRPLQCRGQQDRAVEKEAQNILFGGVRGPRAKDEDQHSDGDSKPRAESAAEQLATQLSMSFNDLQNVFYAKLVTKVGTKRYWELWARDIAQIAEQHIERIKALIADNGKHRKAFDQLMRGLHRTSIPGALRAGRHRDALAAHLSRPVFEALFENYQFAASNPISRSMQQMLDLLDDETKTEEEPPETPEVLRLCPHHGRRHTRG